MSQAVEDIKPSYPLFRTDEYKESLKNKQEQFEEKHPQEKIEQVFQWTIPEHDVLDLFLDVS